MSFNQYKVYLILFILALASWFLSSLFDEDEHKEFVVAAHSPDFFSSNYYKKEMDAEGLVKSELNADKMTHYSDDGTTHLENPVMILHNPDVPPWIIKAKNGILEADKDHVFLEGGVNIDREGHEKSKAFTINTTNLQVQLSISYAETKEWAEVIDGSNNTQGVGMETFFVDPVRIKFLSKVKGRYEFK
jgi:lipopolysaccharide export system protein LptC